MSNEPLLYGGQAVIKGVMMRSPKFFAVACRRANDQIDLRVEPIAFPRRPAFLKWAFVRGSMALFDAMLLGIKALMWSAGLAMQDVEEQERAKNPKRAEKELAQAKKATSGAIADIAIGGAMLFGLGIGVFLFIILPNIVAGFLEPRYVQSKIALNLIEGALRVSFFLVYISVVGMMPDIREVFQFHGAEHRAINTFEANRPLDLESTRDFGTIHIRCGTNFILIVLVLSIFIFSLVPWTSVIERIAWRLLLLPLVAGIAYEILRFSTRNCGTPVVRALMAPGLALQKITTRQPSDSQVEVALAALNAVVAAEKQGLPETAASAAAQPAPA